jgi:hypothetical protein
MSVSGRAIAWLYGRNERIAAGKVPLGPADKLPEAGMRSMRGPEMTRPPHTLGYALSLIA